MSLRISGMGWVTPLGSSVDDVWQRLIDAESGTSETISNPAHERTFQGFRVPPSAIIDAPAHPRLRRSSAISRFAVVAGLAALRDAKVELTPETAARTAIIFAVSNGGVIYTKRFYHDVVETGAQAASPLLFPETVFNAPASHLAAIIGVTGASYTIVGDGAVGLLAIRMAEDLMQDPTVDRCLVVGAEEADWLLCDAYDRWRFLRDAPPIEPFATPPRGMILSEGAGALVVDRTGAIELTNVDAGCNFARQRDAARCVEQVLAKLEPRTDDVVIASANGTFVDNAERAAIARHAPGARVFAPKGQLGESVGAASLWATICAAQMLKTQRLPASTRILSEHGVSSANDTTNRVGRAIVSACGQNQQVAGLALALQN